MSTRCRASPARCVPSRRAMIERPNQGTPGMFEALLLTKADDGTTQAAVTSIDEAQLPEGEVLIDVAYSTVNYKDALAITGKSPVVRKFPMVPGIDLAGTVAESSDARYKKGDPVLLNGWGVGEAHWGGLAQQA